MVLHGSKEQKLANNIFVPTTTNEIAHAWKRIDEFNQRKLRFPIFPLAWWKHLERDKEIQQLVRYSVLLETVSDTPLPPHFPSNYSRTRLQQAKELSNTVSTIRPSPLLAPRRVRSSLQAVRKRSQTMDRSLAHELNNTSFERVQLSSIPRFTLVVSNFSKPRFYIAKQQSAAGIIDHFPKLKSHGWNLPCCEFLLKFPSCTGIIRISSK